MERWYIIFELFLWKGAKTISLQYNRQICSSFLPDPTLEKMDPDPTLLNGTGTVPWVTIRDEQDTVFARYPAGQKSGKYKRWTNISGVAG